MENLDFQIFINSVEAHSNKISIITESALPASLSDKIVRFSKKIGI